MALRPPRGVTQEPMMPFMGGMALPFQPGSSVIKAGLKAIQGKFPKSVLSQVQTTKPIAEQLATARESAKRYAEYATMRGGKPLSKGIKMQGWANKKLVEALETLEMLDNPFGPGAIGP